MSTAQLALDDGDADSCVSRTYYAVFHALVLLFEARGNTRERWSHLEVQRVFLQEFCNRGYLGFNKRDAQTFKDLYRGRLDADYGWGAANVVRSERLLGRAASLFIKIREVVRNG